VDPRARPFSLDMIDENKKEKTFNGGDYLHPRQVLRELEKAMPPDVMVSTDIGNINSVANSYLRFEEAAQLLRRDELRQLRLRLPDHHRRQGGRPHRPAISYAGDGAWGMSLMETMTCVRHNIPVTAVVFHNRQWGAEKKNQVDFYNRRFVAGELDNQSFAGIARAMGAEGITVDKLEDVGPGAEEGHRPADERRQDLHPRDHVHPRTGRSRSAAMRWPKPVRFPGASTRITFDAAVSRDAGLRGGSRASHAFVLDVPGVNRPLLLADCVVNIEPGLMEKRDIVQNAIHLAHAIGIERPRVAILSAVENINPAIASTLDAAALCKMADRGQITGAILDGPLAYDNAVSAASAKNKGIVSEVAGRPDILMLPNLEAGNMVYKQLVYMAGAECAGLVLGMKVPIILTSRSDSITARITSCALAVLVAASATARGAKA
jgi:hypothetical protein